jgi:hypothetical protein
MGVPLVRSVAGDAGTHYPLFFLALPTIYSRVILVLSVVLTCVMVGAAVVLFAQAYGKVPQLRAWATSWRRYPALLAVTGLLAVLLYVVPYLRKLIPDDLFLTNSVARWGTRAGIIFLSVVVQACFAYAAVWVVIRGSGIVAALRNSLRVAASTWLTTFLILAVPVLLLYPLDFATSRGSFFLSKFRPEGIAALLALRIGLEMLVGFTIVGAITRVFLYQPEESR